MKNQSNFSLFILLTFLFVFIIGGFLLLCFNILTYPFRKLISKIKNKKYDNNISKNKIKKQPYVFEDAVEKSFVPHNKQISK